MTHEPISISAYIPHKNFPYIAVNKTKKFSSSNITVKLYLDLSGYPSDGL